MQSSDPPGVRDGEPAMSTAERVAQVVRQLPAGEALRVLQFALGVRDALQMRQHGDAGTAFDRFGAVYDGPLDREALHDRGVR